VAVQELTDEFQLRETVDGFPPIQLRATELLGPGVVLLATEVLSGIVDRVTEA
jgi:hypothetical protein